MLLPCKSRWVNYKFYCSASQYFLPTYLSNLHENLSIMISSPVIHGWMTGGTGHSVPPDAKQKPHSPSHHSSGAAHRGGRPLRGSQGMEFQHFSPNDLLQAARKQHGGAGHQACVSPWFGAERRAGILFRAVCSAAGSTTGVWGPGSFCPWTTKGGKAVQYRASSWCRMLCLLKA